jgi:hypothetical protein
VSSLLNAIYQTINNDKLTDEEKVEYIKEYYKVEIENQNYELYLGAKF